MGKPGIKPNSSNNMPPISSALGWATTWAPMSVPRSDDSSEETRVTMIPAVMAISSAGTWETMPSPTVRMEYS
ncbi:hypothetical protein D3C78_1131610 [compost metagenome]